MDIKKIKVTKVIYIVSAFTLFGATYHNRTVSKRTVKELDEAVLKYREMRNEMQILSFDAGYSLGAINVLENERLSQEQRKVDSLWYRENFIDLYNTNP